MIDPDLFLVFRFRYPLPDMTYLCGWLSGQTFWTIRVREALDIRTLLLIRFTVLTRRGRGVLLYL
jgi:hypothetical protein